MRRACGIILIIMTASGSLWEAAAERGTSEAAEQNSGASLSLKKGNLEIQLNVPAAGPGVPPGNQLDKKGKGDPDPYKETREAIVKDQTKAAVDWRGAKQRGKEAYDQARSTAQQERRTVVEDLEQMHRLLDNSGPPYQRRLEEESTLDLGPNDELGDF